MVWVGHLPILILVVLLGLLSPMTLTSRRWGILAIARLELRTPIAVALLNYTTFPGVMSSLATGIVGHPRPSVSLLASMSVVTMVVVPGRPLLWALRVDIFSIIHLSLIPMLVIVIVILFLHCPFQVHRSVM